MFILEVRGLLHLCQTTLLLHGLAYRIIGQKTTFSVNLSFFIKSHNHLQPFRAKTFDLTIAHTEDIKQTRTERIEFRLCLGHLDSIDLCHLSTTRYDNLPINEILWVDQYTSPHPWS